MLSSAEFIKLTQAEKVEYVLAHGQYLHYRVKGWCKIDLYLLKISLREMYYAELWYYYDLKNVGLVRLLENMPDLEPYVENIQIRVG